MAYAVGSIVAMEEAPFWRAVCIGTEREQSRMDFAVGSTTTTTPTLFWRAVCTGTESEHSIMAFAVGYMAATTAAPSGGQRECPSLPMPTYVRPCSEIA